MKIIGFVNRKGGVGKTTSVLNVGASLVLKSKKVLLIDLDPQGNLSRSILGTYPKNTIFTLAMGDCTLKEVVLKVRENLLLIPCNKTFARFERQFAGESLSQHILSGLLDTVRKQYGNWLNYVILDCPPSLGLITVNALVASHELYIPMETQQYSLDGLEQVKEEVDKVQKHLNKEVQIKGIFFSRHNPRTCISRDMVDLLKTDYPGLLMKTYIRRNIALEESPSVRKNIFEYASKSQGAKDYTSLTEEILKR